MHNNERKTHSKEGSIHTHFYVHSISNSTVDHVDQYTYFLYRLVDDEIAPDTTSHHVAFSDRQYIIAYI